MEILFVTHQYPPSIGGMQKQSFELINGMKNHATVHTICYDGKKSRVSFFWSLNRLILEACGRHPGISLIHFNDGLIASWSLLHKGYQHLIKTVTVHGLDIVFPNFFFQRFVLPKFNRFDLVIAVSRASAQACIDRGINQEKVVVIRNGVDSTLAHTVPTNETLDWLKNTYQVDLSAKKILVMMGRPVKRKGFSWFLNNVVPKLKGSFTLILIGPYQQKKRISAYFLAMLPNFLSRQVELLLGYPTDEVNIRKALSNPRISDRILHAGKLSQEKLSAVLSLSDAFIMPNIKCEGDMEGFGLVCLEASICGSIVFASRIDGIVDAIHHEKNGFLLPSENPGIWAIALNGLIKDPSSCNLTKSESRSYTMQNFSWNKMTMEYYDQFARLSSNIKPNHSGPHASRALVQTD